MGGHGRLGSFRINEARGNRHGARGGMRLGSFRIMWPDRPWEMGNSNLEIRDKPEIRNAKLET